MWDTKTQTAKGKGILGIVIAFAGADEEQGHKTLHRHWKIWVKEINQTVRDYLFHKDTKTRTNARNTFINHIDNVICANYGSDLRITHNCLDKNINEILKLILPTFIQRYGPTLLLTRKAPRLMQ